MNEKRICNSSDWINLLHGYEEKMKTTTLMLCISILVIIYIPLMVLHENTHVQINTIFGVESKADYLHANTYPLPGQTISKLNEGDFYLAHSINEIVFNAAYIIIVMMVILVGLLLHFLEKKENE